MTQAEPTVVDRAQRGQVGHEQQRLAQAVLGAAAVDREPGHDVGHGEVFPPGCLSQDVAASQGRDPPHEGLRLLVVRLDAASHAASSSQEVSSRSIGSIMRTTVEVPSHSNRGAAAAVLDSRQ